MKIRLTSGQKSGWFYGGQQTQYHTVKSNLMEHELSLLQNLVLDLLKKWCRILKQANVSFLSLHG